MWGSVEVPKEKPEEDLRVDEEDGGLDIVGPSPGPVVREDGRPLSLARRQMQTWLGERRHAEPCCQVPLARASQALTEEAKWEQRRKQTGLSGRIVSYSRNEYPQHDVVFRDGASGRILVSMVIIGGKAWRAGVSAGDVLVSINGKKDFAGLPACEVHACLTGPVTLVFVGFVGSLQSEVRLNHQKAANLGLPTKQKLAAGMDGAKFQVVDEVIFDTCPFSPHPHCGRDGAEHAGRVVSVF